MKPRFALVFSIGILLLVGVPAFAGTYIKNTANPETAEAAGYTGDDPVIADNGAGTAKDVNHELSDESNNDIGSVSDDTEDAEADAGDEVLTEPLPLPRYDAYLAVNPYVAGWLTIDGVNINDPVVYTPGSQNYFLHRALDGSDSERGTFFIAINWQDGFNHTLIYGHNMKDGSGFGSLLKYADSGFGLGHRSIHFDTLYEDREYELLGVFYSQIQEDELETEEDRAEADRLIAENTIDLGADWGDIDIYREEKDEDNGRFRYYYYTDLEDEDDFNYYVENVKARSLYDTGSVATYGDELLTLSTCSYQVKNGRFVVVAVHHRD